MVDSSEDARIRYSKHLCDSRRTQDRLLNSFVLLSITLWTSATRLRNWWGTHCLRIMVNAEETRELFVKFWIETSFSNFFLNVTLSFELECSIPCISVWKNGCLAASSRNPLSGEAIKGHYCLCYSMSQEEGRHLRSTRLWTKTWGRPRRFWRRSQITRNANEKCLSYPPVMNLKQRYLTAPRNGTDHP